MPSTGSPTTDIKPFVAEKLNDIQSIAESWLSKLQQYLDAQTNIFPTLPTLPTAPAVPDMQLPLAPDISGIGNYTIPDAPTWQDLPAGLGHIDCDIPELACVTPAELPELVLPDIPDMRQIDAPDLDFTLDDLPSVSFTEFTPSVTPQIPTAPPSYIPPPKPGGLTLDVVDLPTAPTLTPLPPLSTLADIPDVNLDSSLFAPLTFDYDLPDISVDPPDFSGMSHTPAEFESEVMEPLRLRLLGIMQDAYVLPEDFEQRQFDHVVEREREITNRAVANLSAQFAARGFPLPPGLLYDAERLVRLDAELKERTINREFWIERRKMEYQALLDSMKSLIDYAQLEEDIWKTKETLIVEAQKALIDVMYRTFTAQLDMAKLAYMELEKELAMFAAQREAQQANLKIQLAKLETAKLVGERNAQLVALDELRLKQSLRALEYFDAEVKAVNAKMEQQNLLIRNHTEEYRAWATEVDAGVKQYSVYSTLADIANATARVVESEARAYDANTRAHVAQLDAVAKNNGARADAVRAQADVYRTEVQTAAEEIKAVSDQINALSKAFVARASAQTEAIRANAAGVTARYGVMETIARVEGDSVKYFFQGQSARMSAYAEQVRGIAARANVDTEVARAKVAVYTAESNAVLDVAKLQGQITSNNFNLQLTQWKLTAQESINYAQWAREKLLAMAQYASNVANGALSALNVQAGISASESQSVSNSSSISQITSNNTNTNYNYS